MNNKLMLIAVLLFSCVTCAMELEKENSLIEIQKWQDVTPFAGEFVAYTASTYYLDDKKYKYLLPKSTLSYGYVEKKSTKWRGCVEGHQLHQLLKRKCVDGTTALVNEYIDEGSLCMRKITSQEAKEIIEALISQKARLSSMFSETQERLVSQLKLLIEK